MNLTDPEVRVLLWHIKVVEDAYGNEAPCQSTIDNAKHKLQSELEENGVYDPRQAVVAPQGAHLPEA